MLCAPATEFCHLITAPVEKCDLGALRLSVSGGESLNPEVIKRGHELTGIQLLDGYDPTEVENDLIGHVVVIECAVIANPAEERGEIVKAFAVLRPELAPSDKLVTRLQTPAKETRLPKNTPGRPPLSKACRRRPRVSCCAGCCATRSTPRRLAARR